MCRQKDTQMDCGWKKVGHNKSKKNKTKTNTQRKKVREYGVNTGLEWNVILLCASHKGNLTTRSIIVGGCSKL